MPYGQLPAGGNEIRVNALRGIQLRRSRAQLESGETDRAFGSYPNQTGQRSRIPGKTTWRVFEDEDGNQVPVLQVAEASMGQPFVIVQFGDSIGLYTLDEMRNRTPDTDLTPTVSATSTAIIGNSQANGVNGGSLGTSPTTFYQATVNLEFTDSDEIVSTSGNSFSLAAGTYRIYATVMFAAFSSTGGISRSGLFNLTNNSFQTQLGTSAEILSTSFQGARQTEFSSGFLGQRVKIFGRFTVPSGVETFCIKTSTGDPSISAVQGTPASGVTSKNENYSLIKITRE